MAEKKKTVYRLFAMSLADTTEKAIEQYRFCRVTTFYTLVYTADETPPENAIVIEGEDVERLSSADRDWLLGCNMTLIAEDMKDREKEITADLSQKIEKLEQALEEAKRTGGQNQWQLE